MLSVSLTVFVDEGGPFDELFAPFTEVSFKSGARLLRAIETFARNQRSADYCRGRGHLHVYIVPSRKGIELDRAAGAIVLVDESQRIAEPIRFLEPRPDHDWEEIVCWVERYLNI